MIFKKIIKILFQPRQVISNRMPRKAPPPLQIRIWNDLLGSLKDVLEIKSIESLNNATSVYGSTVNFDSHFIDPVLSELFLTNGTDKDRNGYSSIYSSLLAPLRNKPAILVEVGIGTNNPALPSNMGATGIPGASLRAFSHYLGDSATCIGLDIDTSILFQTNTIKTMFVNQLDRESFKEISDYLTHSNGADLIIDDGLHRPISCINTIIALLRHLRLGGYYIVEDQDPTLHEYWNFVLSQLGSEFSSSVIYTRDDVIVVVVTRLRKTELNLS
jgi:hypothetical protein